MRWPDCAGLWRPLPGSAAATGPLRAAGLPRGADFSPGQALRDTAVPLPEPVPAMPPSLFSANQNHRSPNRAGAQVCERAHPHSAQARAHAPHFLTRHRRRLETTPGVRRGPPGSEHGGFAVR